MTGSKNKIICRNEESLPAIAASLINNFQGKSFFAFYGEMGAGKTTLIKAICEHLNVTDTVCSPTFSIVNIYQTRNRDEIYHFDLYRINSIEELFDIGYEDYFYSGTWCLVEWPEKIETLLPEDTVKVHIEVAQSEGYRIISF